MKGIRIPKKGSSGNPDLSSETLQDLDIVNIKEFVDKSKSSIEEINEKINSADEISKSAIKIKGFFKQKKINRKLLEANSITNEAVRELSKLIQSSVDHTVSSLQVVSIMYKKIMHHTMTGIDDTNRRVETFADVCSEIINAKREESYDFNEITNEISARFAKIKLAITVSVCATALVAIIALILALIK